MRVSLRQACARKWGWALQRLGIRVSRAVIRREIPRIVAHPVNGERWRFCEFLLATLRDRKFRELLPTSEKLGRLTGTATTTSERVFPKAAVGCDVFEGYGKVGGECFAGPSRAPVECEG